MKIYYPTKHAHFYLGKYPQRLYSKSYPSLNHNMENSSSPFHLSYLLGASLVAQTVNNLPAMQETQVQSLGWEDPLEKGMATYCSILAWRIPWTEEPGRVAKSQTD